MGAAADKCDPLDDRDSATILVVEDEPLIRLAITIELRDEGYKVIEAGTGDEAILALSSGEPIDLVFSDVLMPGTITGLALASWMQEQRPEIHIILTSGSESVLRSIGEGAIPFIPKPYRPVRVMAMIARLLSKRAQSGT